MTPREAIAQLARVATTIDGIREAQYPAEGQTPKYPSLVLLWGETTIAYQSTEQYWSTQVRALLWGETTIASQSTEQYWSMQVRGLLLTGLTNELKHHVAEVDPLIAKVADKFSAGNFDGFTLRTANGEMCDGCQLTSATPASLITYSGQDHYGANLIFSIELRRFYS